MRGRQHRAVFLDRDGVLNQAVIKDGKPYPPSSLAELELTPDARGPLETLKAAGFLLIGITNQPDVARGTMSREVVEAINARILAALPLQEILVCYHDDGDHCDCRKPAPGLLLRAAAQNDVDLSRSYMVGDRWRDVDAGRRAGCRTIFVDRGYLGEPLDTSPDWRVHSLREAVEWIVEQSAV
ncbi:MAG: HAD family hydrolase [Chloroflexi bacterium]|nr:HAD family hydrolase [Chloroflexota bacterium]